MKAISSEFAGFLYRPQPFKLSRFYDISSRTSQRFESEGRLYGFMSKGTEMSREMYSLQRKVRLEYCQTHANKGHSAISGVRRLFIQTVTPLLCTCRIAMMILGFRRSLRRYVNWGLKIGTRVFQWFITVFYFSAHFAFFFSHDHRGGWPTHPIMARIWTAVEVHGETVGGAECQPVKKQWYHMVRPCLHGPGTDFTPLARVLEQRRKLLPLPVLAKT
jgi:hypothetical protein